MRLIDADAFKEYLSISFDKVAPELSKGYLWLAKQITEDLIKDIDEAPTIQPQHGEMVNKHSFCDFVRDWMSKKLDPMAIRPEEMTHKMLYRSWVELWWLLDHYFEHEPPKWGDEKDGE